MVFPETLNTGVERHGGRTLHKICILSELQTEEWRETGVRPDCRTHRHMNQKRAEWMLRNNPASLIEPAGVDAVTLKQGRRMAKVYVGRGPLGGPGMPVVQLVVGAAAHVIGGKCWCGQSHSRQKGKL